MKKKSWDRSEAPTESKIFCLVAVSEQNSDEPQMEHPTIITVYTPVPSELYINVWQFMTEFLIS